MRKETLDKIYPQRPSVYTDDTVLDFGIHKGKRLEDVPASYLLYLYENGKSFGALHAYIKDNLDVLVKQFQEEKQSIWNR